jgi:nucleoside-diphosphate-sugar epimerase
MVKILVTGTSGFVGQNLIRYLGDWHFKTLTINREQFQSQDFSSVNEAEAVIHLAGKAHDIKKISNPDEYDQINFELTKKLYDAFLQSNATKFIFISSVKAVADNVDSILEEDHTPDPVTEYGKSKLKAERYIQKQLLPEGKSYYILRPCMIHGPGNKGNLNLLYEFIERGVPYPLAAFKNKRSFLSIQNFCFVVKQLLEKSPSSGVYNIADDDALSTNEIVSILAESLGKKVRLWKIPSGIIKLLAKLGDKIKLPLNTETLKKLTENYVVNNSKIKETIKTEFPISAKKGLEITARSFNKKTR